LWPRQLLTLDGKRHAAQRGQFPSATNDTILTFGFPPPTQAWLPAPLLWHQSCCQGGVNARLSRRSHPMKTTHCWPALFALCVAAPAVAQTGMVAGIVIDDRTEQPISGALVYVENQSSLAETDADGRFNLAAPHGRQTIVASVIGYALLRTEVDIAAEALE